MPRASLAGSTNRDAPVHRRRPLPSGSAAGAGRMWHGRSFPRIADAPTAPDAADRMRRAFRSPLSPRQEMATVPPGGEHGGRHRRGARQPRGRRAFPRASPFPPVGRSPPRDTPRQACPLRAGAARRAEPERRGTAQVRPLARRFASHAKRPTAARPARVPDAPPAAWLPPSAPVRARRRMTPRAHRRCAPTPSSFLRKRESSAPKKRLS
jgi:hypothetical protein